MLQDPEGLLDERMRRRGERLVEAHLARLLEGERRGITFRHSLAVALRRLAERIDTLGTDLPPAPERGPGGPDPAV